MTSESNGKQEKTKENSDGKQERTAKEKEDQIATQPAGMGKVTKSGDNMWTDGPMNADTEQTLADLAFDAKAWMAAFRQAKHDNDENRVAFLRRVVQRGTDSVLRNKSYERDEKVVKLLDYNDSIKRTALYDGKSAFGSFNRTHQTTAHFVKADCVDVALFLIDKKNVSPCVLVMADEQKPGGHWEEGSCAQEEAIYRRTTLKLSLEDPDQVDREREWKYEIAPFGGVYAPDVQVFRSSESRGYEYLPQPKRVSFVSASSLVKPSLVERKKKGDMGLSDEDAKTMKRKIDAVLSIALSNGHDAIVLSAWGCGYNQLPPSHVARLFREVITSNFPACFRHVCFAILDDENTRQAWNPDGNTKPFQEEFLSTDSRGQSKKCSIM